MTIAIDARTLISDITGVANFLKLSILSLSKRKDIRIILFSPRPLNTALNEVFPSNVEVVICPMWGIAKLPKLLWLLVMMPYLLRKYKANIYYSPTPSIPWGISSKVCSVITVHDVVNIEYAHTMKWNNRISNWLIFNRSVKKADILWANSEYTKAKIEHYFPHRKANSIFVGCSVDTDIYKAYSLSPKDIQEMKNKLGIKNHFLLFVGSLEPRKNLAFLLSLMPVLYTNHGLQLVIVGAKGWKNSHIYDIVANEYFPKESVIFTGYLSNEELAKLYNIADCFVSTSLNEGFGMPQLEALLCNCPVVTAHNSAMIEVVSGYGETVKGWDETCWIDTIVKQVENGRNDSTKIVALQTKYDWNRIVSELCTQFPSQS